MEEVTEKLKWVLSAHFAGSVLELDPVVADEKTSGSLLWQGFEEAEQLDRQRQVSRVLREELTLDERRRVSIIFTFTPEEAAVMREG